MARTLQFIRARSSRGLFYLAAGSGLVAAILVFVALTRLGGGDDRGAAPGTASNVVVAQGDIPVGRELTAEMIKLAEVPNSLVLEGHFTEVEPLIGETTRYPIMAGEQITRSKVGPQVGESNGLAFVVPKGKRALSVEVNEISSVGGLLLPGDRVDIIAVLDMEDLAEGTVDPNLASDQFRAAFTVLQDIEILAVAQEAQQPVPAANLEETAAAGAEGDSLATSGQRPRDAEPNANARTVTLAVTPDQAQLLALVDAKSDLWLSLRPFGEGPPVDLPGVVNIIPLEEFRAGHMLVPGGN